MPRHTNKLVSTIQTACQRASTASAASYSIENCPIRSFAKNHSEAARLLLETPPFSHDDLSSSSSRSPPFHRDNNSNNNYEQETLEDYLKWRRWDVKIDKIRKEHQLGDPALESAAALLSHPLTFPLTLGRHAHRFLPSPSKRRRRGDERTSCRICCVGARSECTLPDEYWKEFLIVTLARGEFYDWDSERDMGRNRSSASSFEWIIDFVGPDVPTHLTSKSVSLFGEDELRLHPQRSLTMNYHASFLHDLILRRRKEFQSGTTGSDIPPNFNRAQTIRQHWDGFVLFNPGLGHPHLAKQWEATFRFLCDTHKPILLTAHSATDARRDLAAIQKMRETLPRLDIGGDGYRANPYASRMKFIDPFQTGEEGSVHVVRPNHSLLFL